MIRILLMFLTREIADLNGLDLTEQNLQTNMRAAPLARVSDLSPAIIPLG
jgi:hypothetical protein